MAGALRTGLGLAVGGVIFALVLVNLWSSASFAPILLIGSVLLFFTLFKSFSSDISPSSNTGVLSSISQSTSVANSQYPVSGYSPSEGELPDPTGEGFELPLM